MADRTEALVLQMSADIRRMERSLNQARGIANTQLGAIEKRFDKMTGNIKRSGEDLGRSLRASIAAIGVGMALREVVDYGDAWTTARNKLAAAGVSQTALAATMGDLVNLAKETRSEFSGTVDLYAKLTRAGQQLNLTQGEVRRITETTLQAFVAGGAAASEQAAAITQLSQALGSGILQGDELRSIRENAPLLAEAIAKEFNTTIAGLKELGAEGELTADRVARAILNADGITDAFGRTISTVAQAMTNLVTEFTRYIAESRIAQTVTQALGGFIQFVTDNIDLLADAAIVAAAVIGGTLAAQAIGRFVTSLRGLRADIGRTVREFGVLRAAMSFLGGPVGAAVLGIGAALGAMALSAMESSSAAERAADSLEKLGKIRNDITTQTAQLQAAQERLNKAIREGGEAAQIAGALEVDRLRKLVEASRALFQLERARAQQALNDRSTEFRTKYIDVPGLQAYKGFGRTTLENADFNILTPALQARGQSIEQFSASIGAAARIRNLTDEEKALSAIAQAFLAYREEMRSLTEQVKEYDRVLGETSLKDGAALPFPEFDKKGSGSGGAAGVRGFRTELERLNDTLKEIGDEASLDAKFIDDAVKSVSSLLNTDQSAEDFTQKWKDANDQLTKAYEDSGRRAAERSRQAVQAVLDFADGGNLAAAFAKIPSLADVLIGEDADLLRSELQKRATTLVEDVADGLAAAEMEFRKKWQEINEAEAAAMAAGLTNLRVFAEARQALFDDMADKQKAATDKRLDAFDAKYPIAGIPSTSDQLNSIADIGDVVKQQLIRDGLIPTEAMLEFQERMRDSVKNAMRDGIATGDWGDALKSVLADAITEGLDSALNRLADWLFAQDGPMSGFLNSVGSWLGSSMFGGARAGGGSVAANRAYRVNDRADNGEFLFMGSNPGQVLRASDLNQMLGAPAGGSVSINAPLIVEGSIDAVTWPKVEAAMRQQARSILSSVPAAVNATLVDNRIQKRRL